VWWCMLESQLNGRVNRRVFVQASLGIKWDPISKITKRKNVGIQVVECLPIRCQALSSKPSATKRETSLLELSIEIKLCLENGLGPQWGHSGSSLFIYIIFILYYISFLFDAIICIDDSHEQPWWEIIELISTPCA
jgi:hypothetical protein